MTRTRVVVAMSGGVDSSVAAALLVEQGYEVIGMMLRLWAEEGLNEVGKPNTNRCCAPEAVADARAIANQLGIPFYDIHAESVFKQRVVDSWVEAYARAETPNPCLNCNRSIRFGFLMQKALALGADFLATGHYAKVTQTMDDGRWTMAEDRPSSIVYRLHKGLDPRKDQSYVLHVLGQKDLARAMFPCGGYTKPQVRELARKFGLPTAERAESQDLCFLTQGDYRGFLTRNAPHVAAPGAIINTRGEKLGTHEGLPFYTVGQRKGIGIAATSSNTKPMFVLRMDAASNALIVGTAEELGARRIRARVMHYVSGEVPSAEMQCMVKVRYKAKEMPATLRPCADGGAVIEFDEPSRDATPGQAAVAYVGDEVIGGGIIAPQSEWGN
ncbi:MAG TPA: tRNA 2-thiouridine(34) synthase MnmA [Thermoflexales bacterium]|nr:tRNA 2-thiouridine(34) synthase MnmA [Thermoflexales bacterium]